MLRPVREKTKIIRNEKLQGKSKQERQDLGGGEIPRTMCFWTIKPTQIIEENLIGVL